MKSLVRPVQIQDIADFEKIWREFILSETNEVDRFLHPLKFSGSAFLLSKLWKFFFSETSFWDNFLVYEVDNKIAGFMEIFSPGSKAYQFFIRNFVISRAFRNRGYGSAFLKEIIKRFSSSGGREIFLEVRHDNRAVNFYKKSGFINIASRYYMTLLKDNEKLEKEKSPGFRSWNHSSDRDKLNDLMEGSSMVALINLIPFFPRCNYIDHYLDNLFFKLKRQRLDVYVLENDKNFQAYGVIYSYFKHNKALLEIIFNPGISHTVIEDFLKAIIDRIKPETNILFSFMDTQKVAGSVFKELGGSPYRENIIMRFASSD
ncbi:MAG TPA: GNAT family N-acetyltransferase [Candidatus Eremiobacteraeota bacterium]|nr:GNAT family N-acetyltransferase [Candidatus Eremiobacteraeota bacterium]